MSPAANQLTTGLERRTFLVNGRGFDIDSIDFTDLSNLTDRAKNASYYEVSGAGVKGTLIYEAPPNMHVKVLETALAKWFVHGCVDAGIAQFPADRFVEV